MDDSIERFEAFPQSDMVILRKEDLYPIWDKCSCVSNANLRARMAANLFSAFAASRILEQCGLKPDTTSALQEIPSVLSKWDISEVYVNDCKISVRYAFGDYKYFVSKKQERYGLVGDLFMFLRVSDDLTEVKLEGFLPYKSINKSNSDSGNYYFHSDEFKQFEDVKRYFGIKKPSEDVDEMKKERLKIIKYIDGTLEDKIGFFKLLSDSRYLRGEMIKFENSEKMFSQIVEKEDLIKERIEEDITNISKLADAFMQSREKILSSSDSGSFKLECARANLEKLFNSSSSEDTDSISIHDKTTDEVMDTLLTPSGNIIQDDRLPAYAVLRALRFLGTLIVLIIIAAGIFCFTDYSKYVNHNTFTNIKNYM